MSANENQRAAKEQTYLIRRGDGTDIARVRATSPAKALRLVCGDSLVSQDGRYGRLADGLSVAALLVHGGRRTYPSVS